MLVRFVSAEPRQELQGGEFLKNISDIGFDRWEEFCSHVNSQEGRIDFLRNHTTFPDDIVKALDKLEGMLDK